MLELIALWWTFLKLRWGSPQIRRETAIELGQLGNPRAVDPLIAALDRDLDMRREIATALGRIGDPRAANALLGLLLDKSAATRLAAVWALGQVGDTRAVEPLAAVLSSDGDADVCQTAAESLIRLGDARGIGRGVPALIQRLRRDSRGRRFDFEHACEIVLKVGEPAVEPLIAALSEGEPVARQEATKVLALLRDGRAVDPLMAATEDPDEVVRWAAKSCRPGSCTRSSVPCAGRSITCRSRSCQSSHISSMSWAARPKSTSDTASPMKSRTGSIVERFASLHSKSSTGAAFSRRTHSAWHGC